MTEAQRESLCALIRQAGAHAQALRDAGLQVDKKARQDFVSQADLAVEQEIKGWLQAHFPEEGFLGEESGFEGDDQTVWVLDPVDGTTNFILGMDYWCISLARVCQGELSLGIIYAPDRDEFFFAARGEGAYLNGRRLTLREPEPDAVVIGMGRSSRAPASDYARAIDTLLDAGLEYRRFGAGALMLAHVAAGTIFSNEVSLAVNFQNVTVVAFDFGFDHAVSSHVACFLRRFDRAGFTHVFDCQLDVAIRFSQRFFAIHHACASTFAQLFYQGSGNFSHSKILGRCGYCPANGQTA